MTTALATLASVGKVLGHRGRLRVLAVLDQGPMSVCQMASALEMPVSTLSGLLLDLRECALIREERRGKWIFYQRHDAVPVPAVVDAALAHVGADPQIRKDIAAAAELRGCSPATVCAAVGLTPRAKDKR